MQARREAGAGAGGLPLQISSDKIPTSVDKLAGQEQAIWNFLCQQNGLRTKSELIPGPSGSAII
jgi:hypothetical protein